MKIGTLVQMPSNAGLGIGIVIREPFNYKRPANVVIANPKRGKVVDVFWSGLGMKQAFFLNHLISIDGDAA